ncbi:hypothetical protein [Streptomyces kronopolitis]|uniref:hypothetical protein n=1 Tax=Streptomyces kronopolitis TaxID=1612435 RepID=UPI00341EC974
MLQLAECVPCLGESTILKGKAADLLVTVCGRAMVVFTGTDADEALDDARAVIRPRGLEVD